MTRAWDDVTEGEKAPPEAYGPITRTDIVRYQGASGDMNPIHHDEPFALSAGYQAPLVVGMLPAGALLAWAAEWFSPIGVRKCRIRWKEQVWPGESLEFSGQVVRKLEANGERLVEVELQATREGGGVAVQAWATFAV